jgi:hypothetical protein
MTHAEAGRLGGLKRKGNRNSKQSERMLSYKSMRNPKGSFDKTMTAKKITRKKAREIAKWTKDSI